MRPWRGDEVVVTNGTYTADGGQAVLSVRSNNGPQFTTIDAGGSGRCAYLTNSASAFRVHFNQWIRLRQGAGVWCQSAKRGGFQLCDHRQQGFCKRLLGVASVNADGGGAYGGHLNDCTLTGTRLAATTTISAPSRGDYGGRGGGAAYCTLNDCTLSGNSATVEGFYIYAAHATRRRRISLHIEHCTLTGNSSAVEGLEFTMRTHKAAGPLAAR